VGMHVASASYPGSEARLFPLAQPGDAKGGRSVDVDHMGGKVSDRVAPAIQ